MLQLKSSEKSEKLERLDQRILRLRWGSRALLVGQTGSGKTTLARVLLDSLASHDVVILDPKGNFNYSGAFVYETIEDLLSSTEQIKTFRPHRGRGTLEEWNTVLAWVYDRENTVLYIDEVYGIGIPERRVYPPELHSIYTRGRERGITVIAGSQRPRFIPLYMLTESQKFYVFRLSNGDDRNYIASYTHSNLKEAVIGHQFWYFEDTSERAFKVKLTL